MRNYALAALLSFTGGLVILTPPVDISEGRTVNPQPVEAPKG